MTRGKKIEERRGEERRGEERRGKTWVGICRNHVRYLGLDSGFTKLSTPKCDCATLHLQQRISEL
jgi:hypothetical protein